MLNAESRLGNGSGNDERSWGEAQRLGARVDLIFRTCCREYIGRERSGGDIDNRTELPGEPKERIVFQRREFRHGKRPHGNGMYTGDPEQS